MGDLENQFCITLQVTQEEAEFLQLLTAYLAEHYELPEDVDEFEADLNMAQGEYDPDDGTYTFTHETGQSSLGELADCFSVFLEEYHPDQVIVIEESECSSSVQSGAYGGIAFVVTATEVHSYSTNQWVTEKLAALGIDRSKVIEG